MSNTLRAFLITGGLLGALVLSYVLIELVRGHVPFAMIQWAAGGKFITISFSAILLIGTAVGYASDHIRAKQGR